MIVIVAGVSGSGKTTVGRALAARLGWEFTDGDGLHPAANIAKMSAGHPLTDADREPWLAAIGRWLDDRLAAAEPAVLACSALKRAYRQQLLSGRPAVRIAFLEVSPETARSRMTARHGHFFAATMLDSQLAILQNPAADEPSVLVVRVRLAERPDEEVAEIIGGLGLAS